MSDKVTISKTEYERFLKWKNEVDVNDEKINITVVKEFKYGEGCYENPNEYSDCVVCKLVSFDRRYNCMGVEDSYGKQLHDSCESWKEVAAEIEKDYGKCYFRLVDLYDHSSLSMSFTDFENPRKYDRWDSSISGICFIPEKELRSMRCLKDNDEITDEIINQEFEWYCDDINMYLNGTGEYLFKDIEISKSTLREAFENKYDLEELLEHYGEEKDRFSSFYVKDRREAHVISEQMGNDLVLDIDDYYGNELISLKDDLSVEELLGIKEVQTEKKENSISRSR